MRLRYVTDDVPGFTRKKGLFSFVYLDVQGRKIRDGSILKRLRTLGVPPAYTHVWFSPFENGHLQATARDARGRKQYVYHADWIAERDEVKFHRMRVFANALSPLRRKVVQDLSLQGIPKEKILAAIVKLLDVSFVRIGNEEYARENDSFGLTTLQHHHVHGSGATLRLVFKGKSGVVHEVALADERLRKIVAACQDIPGHELFEYIDEEHHPHSVTSDQVNDYLQHVSQEEITAKDFRTWHGSVIAAQYLWGCSFSDKKSEVQKNINMAVKKAAEALGNTEAVCRKSYIHPEIIARYQKGLLFWKPPSEGFRKKFSHLRVHEVAFIKFLDDI